MRFPQESTHYYESDDAIYYYDYDDSDYDDFENFWRGNWSRIYKQEDSDVLIRWLCGVRIYAHDQTFDSCFSPVLVYFCRGL